MRALTILLLLPAVAAAADEKKLAPVTLPVASAGVDDKGVEKDDRLVISLDADGWVHAGGKTVSLEELSAFLSREKKRYHEKRQKRGLSGWEQLPGGARATRLFVLLRIDRDAPWVHAQWLMVMLAEQKIYKLHFGVKKAADRSYTEAEARELGAKRNDVAAPAEPWLEAKLKAFLPADRGLHPMPQEPVNEIVVAVHIVARKHERKEWGPRGAKVPVLMPAEVRYRFGDREGDLAAVAKWVKDAQKAVQGVRNAVVKGELKAGKKVPFKYVVALLDRFRETGLADVDFFGTVIPAGALRKRAALPYPERNTIGVEDG